jgi:hypothetical protein
MSQTVRPNVGSIGHQRDPGVHHSTDGPLVEAPATRTKEERGATVGGGQARSPRVLPTLNSLHSRDAEGNGPLLVALAEHSDDVARLVDVVNVEADELANSNAGGIEEFEHRVVAQLLRARLPWRQVRRRLEQRDSLGLREHPRQESLRLRRGQDQTWVGSQPTASGAERCEHSGGCRMPGDRRSRPATGGQLGKPAAQNSDIEVTGARLAHSVRMVKQTPNVGGICPNRVFRQPALKTQVADEGGENVRSVGRRGRGLPVYFDRELSFHSERCALLDVYWRTHYCTVAGRSRAVKYRVPDAPKVADQLTR